jgi:hypothetical protein
VRDELHGSRQNGKRIFLADTIERRDGLEHGSPPKTARHLNPMGPEMQTSAIVSYFIAFSITYFEAPAPPGQSGAA